MTDNFVATILTEGDSKMSFVEANTLIDLAFDIYRMYEKIPTNYIVSDVVCNENGLKLGLRQKRAVCDLIKAFKFADLDEINILEGFRY